jgi:hypothetical protein
MLRPEFLTDLQGGDQADVLETVESLDAGSKEQLLEWLLSRRDFFPNDKIWAQVCVGIYPLSQELMLGAIQGPDGDLCFAVLCALTDIECDDKDLLAAVAKVALTERSDESEAQWMAIGALVEGFPMELAEPILSEMISAGDSAVISMLEYRAGLQSGAKSVLLNRILGREQGHDLN